MFGMSRFNGFHRETVKTVQSLVGNDVTSLSARCE
jgi:hypothetical protein